MFKIAQEWQQLTTAQLLMVAPLVLQEPTIATKMRILESLLDVEQTKIYIAFSPEQVLSELKSVDWLFETPLNKPLIPDFKVGDLTLVLPQKMFEKCNIIEFAFASAFFDEMTAQGNYKGQKPQPEIIDKLILTLCRPQIDVDTVEKTTYNGDSRERFNPEMIEQRLPLIQLLPPQYKAYFLLYFLGCKRHIAEQFKVLFKNKPEETDKKNKRFKRERAVDFAWIGVIMDLAKEGVFGTFEQTQYTDLYTILYYLAKCYYDADELK